MRRVSLLVVIIFGAGCVSIDEEYPANWSSIQATTNKCPDISGVYADLATDESGQGKTKECSLDDGQTFSSDCLLSEVLDPDHRGEDLPISRQIDEKMQKVLIRQPAENQISIRVINPDNNRVKEILLSADKDDFSCSDGAVKIGWATGGPFSEYPVGGVAFVKLSYSFTKAKDGSLIMKEDSIGGGLILVVPVAASVGHWFRWEPWERFQDRERDRLQRKQLQEQALKAKAETGDYESAYDLFLRMENRNKREAWRWLCRAADDGHRVARRQIAWWHRESNWKYSDAWGEAHNQILRNIGVGPDDHIAYVWYTLAASAGDAISSDVIESLERTMSDADIEKAKQMVRDWKRGQCPSKEHPL